ncbi:MAG: winged helix-turn-helix domain-containing protein [Thermoplasmatota archaeon]
MNGEFDIYQTATGVTAVTNPVQRQIMAALAQQDRQLPELVDLTGKAKPTLSSIHMKELLNRELIAEIPHPTDSRRKIYQMVAKPVGSSSLPVEALRNAVKQYARVNASPGLPVADVLNAIGAAVDSPRGLLETQAKALGRACAGKWGGDEPAQFIKSFTEFVESESLGVPMSADFEKDAYKYRKNGLAMTGTMAGHLLCNIFNGAAEAQQQKVRCNWEGGADWYCLTFT